MKNQYFGDVNDYLKYGLLRCFAEAGLKVGVCWMLTPDDGSSAGGKLAYLSKPWEWRYRDPSLFDALHRAVTIEKQRQVRGASHFLPNARFWDELVPEPPLARSRWLTGALDALDGTDLIFFDPDNGIEVPSLPAARKSSKHVYWQEIEETWSSGASVLVFQHFARVNRDTHVDQLIVETSRRLQGAALFPLRTASVLFLLAVQPAHKSRAATALSVIGERWRGPIA